MKKIKLPVIKTKFDEDEDEIIKDNDLPSLEELETLESQEMKGKLVTCKFCDGSGKVKKFDSMGLLALGSGEKKPCPACGGSGYKRV